MTYGTLSGYHYGLGVGRVAKPVVQFYTAGSERVAGIRASFATAERDVGGSRQAVCVGGIKTGWPAGVHRAGPTANAEDAVGAVGDRGIQSGAGGERVDRLADEGELSVGVRNPMHHLLVGHDVRRGLCGSSMSRV